MKRRMMFILLLLIAGAIVNVAVACAVAWWVEADSRPSIVRVPTERDAAWWDKVVAEGTANSIGAVIVMHDAWPMTIHKAFSDQGGRLRVEDGSVAIDLGEPQHVSLGELSLEPLFDRSGGIASRQDDVPPDTEAETAPHVIVSEARIGVPMRTAALHFVNIIPAAPPNPAVQITGTVRFGMESTGRYVPNWEHFDSAALLWPGFIINTLIYALLLWLLFIAPLAALRMLRRRRGQCEKCAYPVGTSPICTECGAAVLCRSDT